MEDAKKRIADLERILGGGGFRIKDWNCSSLELQEIVNSEREIESPKEVQPATVQQQNEQDTSPTSTEVNLDKQEGIKA